MGLATVTRRPRRTLLAGLACVAVAAVVPSLVLHGGGRSATPPIVLAGAAGGVDSSFNANGVVVQPGSNGATGVAIVPAGVRGAGDTVVSGGDGTHFQVARFASTGHLDPTFGGGITNALVGGASAVTVIPPGVPGAGDVVAVGYLTGSTCGGAQFPIPVVAEYLSTGVLNGAFGSGGVVRTPCPTQGGRLYGVAVDHAGNIYATGVAFGTANAQSTLAVSVGATGHLNWNVAQVAGNPVAGHNPSASQANAAAFSPLSGDLIVAGSSLVNDIQYLTVSAFKTGALDPRFNETGSVMASNRPGSSAAGVTVLSNGNVVAAGSTGSNFLLAQFTGAGGVDTAFAGGQVVNRPSLGSTDGFSSIAYQPFGNLLSAAGTAGSGFGQRMVVAQYNATTGAPNTAFGVGGAVSHPFREFASSLSAVAVDASGRTTGAGARRSSTRCRGSG